MLSLFDLVLIVDLDAQPDSPRDMYWSEQRNLTNIINNKTHKIHIHAETSHGILELDILEDDGGYVGQRRKIK